MNDPVSRLTYLYRQYINKTCTAEELREFFGYAGDPAFAETLSSLADQQLEELPSGIPLPSIDWEYMYSRIIPATPVKRMRSRTVWLRVAAAVILVALGVGGYLLSIRPSGQRVATAEKTVSDVAPGGNKAILRLADGSSIVLDSTGKGLLAQQGNTTVSQQGGQLMYKTADSAAAGHMVYNTILTPRGGQYRVVLPDGSKVWLNAASSLRFPAAFTGDERRVALTGEAYFEIAKNTEKPFRVSYPLPDGANAEVQVLGTTFDIMAYEDERLARTTLLEGSVRVAASAAPVAGNGKTAPAIVQLRPGEQAQISGRPGSGNGGESISLLRNVNTEQVIAWKNGIFLFDHTDIRTVMRQVARWYDVEVVYEGDPSTEEFGGSVSRNENISQVLKLLELTGVVHFKIEGKKITVTK